VSGPDGGGRIGEAAGGGLCGELLPDAARCAGVGMIRFKTNR